MYREAERFEPCVRCEAPAHAACVCCQLPRCKRHLERSGWCERCDEELYRYRKGQAGRGIFIPYYGGMAAIGTATFLAKVLVPVFVIFAMLGFPAILVWRRVSMQRRFLAEKKRAALLPETRRTALLPAAGKTGATRGS